MDLRTLVLRTWPGRLALAALVAILAIYTWFAADLLGSLPSREDLRAFRIMANANILFDSADREVFTIAKEHRLEVPLAKMSPQLIEAVIAVEDRRFYEHDGFDPIRIAGSALASLRAGEAVQGGSTITQQLARQSVGREKTLTRKLKEMLFASRLEHHFSKPEILELYLNKVYFGDGLYGVEAASRGYFGKTASEVTLPEAALLAGLLKAPSTYSPATSMARSEARQGVALAAMLDAKAITRDEYDQALRTPVEIYDGLRSAEPYGRYFKEEVRRQLIERFGAERVAHGGLRVFTTIDLEMQRAAEAAVAQGLDDIEKRFSKKRRESGEPLQAALIAMDPSSGFVRAMVGGRDFSKSSFNRATQAKRQPGSAFKPFIYAAAIEGGYSPDDWIDGLYEPVLASNREWSPDDEHFGDEGVTLREGLRLSSNRAAVRLMQDVGVNQTIRQASAFGFGDLPVVPSVALGAGEVTVSAITSAYGAFANGGAVFPATVIRRVEDADGAVLFEGRELPTQAIRPVTAYLMADMLRGVIDAGTGYTARQRGFWLPAGGKTGTTNEYRDAWFIGFTPKLVTGVWVGYDQPQTIRREGYATYLAVPMWTTFMKAATRGDAPEWIQPPRGAAREAREARAGAPAPQKRSWWKRVFGF
jgi:penicillin-binding protein 1A